MKILGHFLHPPRQILPLCFFIFLVLSGPYVLPGLPETFSAVVLIRRVFIGVIFLLMLRAIRWQKVKIDVFAVLIVIWAIAHLVSYLINDSQLSLTLYRLSQASFVFLLVTYVRQGEFDLMGWTASVRPRYKWIGLVAASSMLGALFVDTIHQQFIEGFRGNRVNFSIWLGQLVTFLFLAYANRSQLKGAGHNSEFLALIATLVAIICCQVISGGRAGLLISLISSCFFCWRCAHSRMTKTAAISAIFLLPYLFSVVLSSNVDRGIHVEVTRNLSESYSSLNAVILFDANDSSTTHTYQDFKKILLTRLDLLSGYRFSIFINTFFNLDFSDLLFGRGVGKFVVPNFYNDFYQPHVIFLNHLGEVGLAGSLACFLLCCLPFFQKQTKSFFRTNFYFVFILWLFVGFAQPELLLSQVGTSFLFWLCYGCLLKKLPAEYLEMKKPLTDSKSTS